ncbi:hypothetical protein CBL22_26535, partial [Shigella flexneri]|uniref:hypothetical protein n=1 Tax=Shigella flexneri TaxID=623 RepID=UPI000B7426BD
MCPFIMHQDSGKTSRRCAKLIASCSLKQKKNIPSDIYVSFHHASGQWKNLSPLRKINRLLFIETEEEHT